MVLTVRRETVEIDGWTFWPKERLLLAPEDDNGHRAVHRLGSRQRDFLLLIIRGDATLTTDEAAEMLKLDHSQVRSVAKKVASFFNGQVIHQQADGWILTARLRRRAVSSADMMDIKTIEAFQGLNRLKPFSELIRQSEEIQRFQRALADSIPHDRIRELAAPSFQMVSPIHEQIVELFRRPHLSLLQLLEPMQAQTELLKQQLDQLHKIRESQLSLSARAALDLQATGRAFSSLQEDLTAVLRSFATPMLHSFEPDFFDRVSADLVTAVQDPEESQAAVTRIEHNLKAEINITVIQKPSQLQKLYTILAILYFVLQFWSFFQTPHNGETTHEGDTSAAASKKLEELTEDFIELFHRWKRNTYVVTRRANLREAPTTKSRVLAKLDPGEAVIVVQRHDNWCQVEILNSTGQTFVTGWIYAKFIAVTTEK